MPRGDKSAYTDKQKRQAEHIEEGYENRGVSKKEAERRAWATENAISHGGRKSGSGRGRAENKEPERKGEARARRSGAAPPRKAGPRAVGTARREGLVKKPKRTSGIGGIDARNARICSPEHCRRLTRVVN